MKKTYALIVLVAVMFGCKDDDPKLSVEQYLTASTNGWVIESILITVLGQEIDALKDPDFISETDPCLWDDATIFATDNTYTVANNTKCDSSEATTVDSGTWSLNSDKTALTLDSSIDDPIIFTKLSVNDTQIRGEVAAGGSTGLAFDATFVFKKK